MTVELVLEVNSRAGAQTVVHALDAYKGTLRAALQRSRRNLRQFENRYGVTTMVFLQEMAAEELAGGDVEYVEWAGEAKLLEGIEAELKELEDVRYRVPWVSAAHPEVSISISPRRNRVRCNWKTCAMVAMPTRL